MKLWQLVLCAFLSAVCTLLSTEPVGSGLAALVAPLLLILIAFRTTWNWKVFVLVFLTQLPLWLYLQKWTFDITIPGWICLSGYMSIWGPLFACLLNKVNTKLTVPIYLTAPTLWVGIECLRGLVLFGGYPWYLTGTGMVDTFLADLAAIGSVWLVSFVTVYIAASTLKLMPASLPLQKAPASILMSAAHAIILICIGTAAFAQMQPNNLGLINVAVIQSNVPQSNKDRWTYEQQRKDITSMFQMTLNAASVSKSEQIDLIVWPETMLPGAGFEVSRKDFGEWTHQFTSFWIWPEELQLLARDVQTPILVGTQTWENIEVIETDTTVSVMPEKHYNSAVLLMTDGSTQRYDKMALTPFGEWMPYVDAISALNDWVRSFAGAAQLVDLEAGVEPVSLKVHSRQESQAEFSIGTPICFEVAMPSVVRNLTWSNGKRNADVLISLSNDGWFGLDYAARLQHNREARLRCIENRTSMIRAANTGVSSVIRENGDAEYARVDGHIAIDMPTIFSCNVNRGTNRPLSVFIGDKVAWCSLFGSILLIVSSYLKRSSSDG